MVPVTSCAPPIAPSAPPAPPPIASSHWPSPNPIATPRPAASTSAPVNAMRVPANNPESSTPTATPRPAHTPIQYQEPICRQCSLTAQSAGDNDVAAPPRFTFEEENPVSDDKPLLVFFTSERSGPARRTERLLA